MNTCEFGTLFQFIRNGMNVKQDKSGNGLPITRIETIADSAINESRVGYAGLFEKSVGGWLLKAGDILFSHINSIDHIGKCAVYRGIPQKLVHGMNLLCLRCDPSKLEPEFGKYLIRSVQFRSKLFNFINKAVNQASVSISNLKSISISIPCLLEQRRIAEVLDRAEGLRVKRRAALAELDTLTQAIFLEMFGESRDQWQISRLKDFFLFRTGKLDSNAAVPYGAYPFFTCSRDDFRIDSYAFDCEALLLAGNNATADYSVKHYKGKFNVYQRTYVITLRDEENSYPYAKVCLERKLAELKRISKGSNTKYLTLELLNTLSIRVPPQELQAEFARRAATVERLKEVQRKSLTEMDALFASLQHRAFRGEL